MHEIALAAPLSVTALLFLRSLQMLPGGFSWIYTTFHTVHPPMEYSRLPSFPIPASIRRRLPRLYPFNRASSPIESSRDLRHELSSSSEPQLPCFAPLADPSANEVQRPSTASDDSLYSGSGASSTPQIDENPIAKYETGSGLRWNRVVPGENRVTEEQHVPED